MGLAVPGHCQPLALQPLRPLGLLGAHQDQEGRLATQHHRLVLPGDCQGQDLHC